MAKTLQRANGQGSVYKLSGRRSKPWRAIVTVGRDMDTGKQLRVTIGYYISKDEALEALINYNKNPYDITGGKATFSDIYGKWSDRKYPTISTSNVSGYKASYKRCKCLYSKPFKDIGLDDLQYIIDTSDCNYPTLKKSKYYSINFMLMPFLVIYAIEIILNMLISTNIKTKTLMLLIVLSLPIMN